MQPAVTLASLIASVRESEAPLDDLERAAQASAALTEMGESMTNHFVQRARRLGMTWAQIGHALGVTRQAVERRFGRSSGGDMPGPTTDLDVAARSLVSGQAHMFADVPRATGGPAGVYTIWMKGQLVDFGHARLSASEARASNARQADGVRGRLVGVRRQPTVRIQKAFRAQFPADMDATRESTERRRAAAVLQAIGEYRVVETESGAKAVELYSYLRDWLPKNGFHPLAA